MRYLFVSAHVDDVSLCCGGAISRFLREGHEITVISLSKNYTHGDLTKEFNNAMMRIGVGDYKTYDLETRHFERDRQVILDILFTYKHYDYIFTHSIDDFHADHATVGRESLRAFKHSNVYSYVGSWNARTITKNYFVTLDECDIYSKTESLEKFESQRKLVYMNRNNVVCEMRINGMMCGSEYAEAFKVETMKV